MNVIQIRTTPTFVCFKWMGPSGHFPRHFDPIDDVMFLPLTVGADPITWDKMVMYRNSQIYEWVSDSDKLVYYFAKEWDTKTRRQIVQEFKRYFTKELFYKEHIKFN